MANSDRPLPTVVQDGKGLWGIRGEYFLFPSVQENCGVTPILQKVTQFHKPKSLTISYCKQFFFTCFCQHLENLQKRKCSMLKLIIVISTSHVRNNKYHETSRELSCWVELLIG